jgi:hypothetical protein
MGLETIHKVDLGTPEPIREAAFQLHQTTEVIVACDDRWSEAAHQHDFNTRIAANSRQRC